MREFRMFLVAGLMIVTQCAFFASGQECSVAEAFGKPQIYDAGSDPSSFTMSDINGDGILDLVVANWNSEYLSVLLGTEDGDLIEQETVGLRSNVTWVSSEDLNGDGANDLVAAVPRADKIYVLINRNQGGVQFFSPVSYIVDDYPSVVKVHDLNGDGSPDLVVSDPYSKTAMIMYNDGDGVFGSGEEILVGVGIIAFDILDINLDTLPDIVAVNGDDDTVQILLNDGENGFADGGVLVCGDSPRDLAAGDLDGDGFIDIVVPNYRDGTISIHIGGGDGVFEPQIQVEAGSRPLGVTLGDLNHDGALDVLVLNTQDHRWRVLLNDGTGSFADYRTYASYVAPVEIIVQDMNFDGDEDIVVLHRIGGPFNVYRNIYVIQGTGDGRFLAEEIRSVPEWPDAIEIQDINGDSAPDIIIAHSSSNITVQLNQGEGNFGPSMSYITDSTHTYLKLGDLDRDGVLDLVTANLGDSSISILMGGAGGVFGPETVYQVGSWATSIAIEDLNGDGFLDIVVNGYFSDSVTVLLNDTEAHFSAVVPDLSVERAGPVAIEDINMDGIPDLVVAEFTNNQIALFIGVGDGSFMWNSNLATVDRPSSIVFADLNGDHVRDMVVSGASSTAGVIAVRFGNEDGTFQSQSFYSTATNPKSIRIGDLNGDSYPDIVAANNGGWTKDSLSILQNRGDGTFHPFERFWTGTATTSVAVGDLDGDGGLDLVSTNDRDHTLSFYFSRCLSSICVADLNKDHQLDMADITAFFAMRPDFNEDGFFDFLDISVFVSSFLAGCP